MTGDWNGFIKQELLFMSEAKATSDSGITASDAIQEFEIVPQYSSFSEQEIEATYTNSKKTGFEESYLKALKGGK